MTAYQMNEAGLLVPQVKDIHLLIDDGGDSDLDFLGFTIILADEFAYRELEQTIGEFCAQRGIVSLHARELVLADGPLADMKVYEEIYRDVFEIAIHELSRANYQRVLSFLTSQGLISGVYEAHNAAFEKNEKLPQGARLAEKYRELYSYVAFPTIELLKKVKRIDDEMRLYVHIDRRGNFQQLAEETVSLAGSSAGALMPVRNAITIILNSWKKVFLKVNAPIRQIHIADVTDFPLIGVTDAFSNFSMNFARYLLKGEQNCSSTQKLKYNLFREVLTTMIREPPDSLDAIEASIKKGFQFDGKQIVPLTDRPVSTLEIGVGL